MDRDLWSAITQAPHPHLGSPWFTVHPCNTEHAMLAATPTLHRTVNTAQGAYHYLIAWLSMYGPLLGVHCDIAALLALTGASTAV